MNFPAAIDKPKRLQLEQIKLIEAKIYARCEALAAASLSIEDPDWNSKPALFQQQAVKAVANAAFTAFQLYSEIEYRGYDAAAYEATS